MREFAHLSLHSEFTIDDSVIYLRDLPRLAKECGMSSVALTDTNLYAALKFQERCSDEGIKPIFGCDMKVLSSQGEMTRLIVLAMNENGYRNLLRLVTGSHANDAKTPHITLSQLTEYSEGVIVLSGGIQGEVGMALLAGKVELAKQVVQQYVAILNDRFYLEISRTGRKYENEYIHSVLQLADECDVPLVATNDVVMPAQSDMLLHDARLCMQRGESMDADYSWKGQYSEQQYLRTPEEMEELFQDIPDALDNAEEICKRCNVEIPTGVLYQRPFPTEDSAKNEQILRDTAREKLSALLADGYADESDPLRTRSAYEKRLETELEVIISMGYAGYFLIVQDMVQWAKDQEIPVGQGRGSGAASLVSLLLGITTIDPLRHKLIFERLLNPERRTMPDLDIDFCGERRDEVAKYLYDKYGQNVVAKIVAHGTKGAKGVIQALGRSRGIPHTDVTRVTNLVPIRPLKITIEEALEKEPRIESTARSLGCEELIEEGKKLEGIVSTLSYHPAGIVIAPGPLDDYVACHREGNHLITQLDKDDVEKAGLVKFDLLSLKNLTAIQKTVAMINEQSEENAPTFDINEIPLDDVATYELLSTGETQAVFQLGGGEIQNLLRNVKPQVFDDILAVIALYRPGPLQAGFHERFYKRKNKEEQVRYDHPQLEDILRDNHGVMIYQEDVMNVARELAGFTLGDADIMREAMGKKRIEKLEQVKDQFLHGCVDRGIDEKVATKVYSDMEGFAEYAFPRAHAAAYAMLSYQTAYLKAHHPKEFMASNMTVFRDDRNQLTNLLGDVLRMNIPVLPPDVNKPNADCDVVGDSICLGFACIKGIGKKHVQCIQDALGNKPFSSFFDFCNRIKSTELTAAKIGILISAGVFDSFEAEHDGEPLRRAVLQKKLERLADLLREDSAAEDGLFGVPDEGRVIANFEVPRALTRHEIESQERDVFGQVISLGDRIALFKEFEGLRSHSIQEASRLNFNEKVTLIGTIEYSWVGTTRKGEEYARISLQDSTAKIDCLLWPEKYREYSRHVLLGEFTILQGKVTQNRNDDNPQVTIDKVLGIDAARKKGRARFVLRFESSESRERLNRENLLQLKQVAEQQKSRLGQDLQIVVKLDQDEMRVDFGSDLKRVEVNEDTHKRLRSIFGNDNVHVQYG